MFIYDNRKKVKLFSNNGNNLIYEGDKCSANFYVIYNYNDSHFGSLHSISLVSIYQQ